MDETSGRPRPSGDPLRIGDPKALSALAHPLRIRLVAEMATREAVRATDLASALDEPVNSVSFHLRQLARYGLIERAEGAGTDGRERWWRMASDTGFRVDPAALLRMEGGAGAVGAMEQLMRGMAIALADTVFARLHHPGSEANDLPYIATDFGFRLTPDEVEELEAEFLTLIQRWMARSRELSAAGTDQDDPQPRETYYATLLAAPVHDVIARSQVDRSSPATQD